MSALYFMVSEDTSVWFRLIQGIIILGISYQLAHALRWIRYDEQRGVELGMLLLNKRFSLQDYEVRVVKLPNLLLHSVRAFGSGGFFGYTGYFYNKEQGRFRLYCTNEKQTNFLELRNKKDGSLTYIAWQTES